MRLSPGRVRPAGRAHEGLRASGASSPGGRCAMPACSPCGRVRRTSTMRTPGASLPPSGREARGLCSL
eukprot:10184711-Heterocapsa_arctica.AAC.1